MMTMGELITLLSALTGIIAVFVSLITATSAAKKDAVTTLQGLVKDLQEQVAHLTKELDKERRENEDLRAWAEDLVDQVRSLGHKPVDFRPRRRPTDDVTG